MGYARYRLYQEGLDVGLYMKHVLGKSDFPQMPGTGTSIRHVTNGTGPSY
jgi:hypothetical protein